MAWRHFSQRTLRDARHFSKDDVRALDSVVKTQNAAIGVLLSIEEPTAKMKQWAATCGDYVSAFNGQKFPRIQLRTIGQLLAGVAIERPSGNVAVDVTFKKAPEAKATGGAQDLQGLGAFVIRTQASLAKLSQPGL